MLVGDGKGEFVEMLTHDEDMPYYRFRNRIGEFSEMYMFAEKFKWTPMQYREIRDNHWDDYMQFKMFMSGMAESKENKG